jgi:hypothetical protein
MGCSYNNFKESVINHFDIWRVMKGDFALRVQVSATPSHYPCDDVAASQPEARGGYHSVAASTFPHFSPVGLLP